MGKKISEYGLASSIAGTEKIPTSLAGDLAITPDKLVSYSAAKMGSQHEYHVGTGAGMYPTIRAAIDAINAGPAPTQAARALIWLHSGEHTDNAPLTVPNWTTIKGVSKGAASFYNDASDCFVCGHDVYFEDFIVTVGATAGTFAFIGNNSDAIHIRNVDFLNFHGYRPQGFLKQEGATWKILFIERCVIDYRHTSGYAIELRNTSGASRWVDSTINDCFIDAYALTAYGGGIAADQVQDIRVWNSTIRGQAPHNTGVRLTGASATFEIRNSTFNGFNNTGTGVSVYGAAGSTVYLSNTDAPGSIFDGAVVNRGSIV